MKRGIKRSDVTNKIRMIFTIGQVKTMIQIFIDLIKFRPFSSLTASHFSDHRRSKPYFPKEVKPSLKKGFLDEFVKLPLIHPNSRSVFIYDIIITIIFIVSLIYYPIRISFMQTVPSTSNALVLILIIS